MLRSVSRRRRSNPCGGACIHHGSKRSPPRRRSRLYGNVRSWALFRPRSMSELSRNDAPSGTLVKRCEQISHQTLAIVAWLSRCNPQLGLPPFFGLATVMAGEFVAAGGDAREAVMALNCRQHFFLKPNWRAAGAAVSLGKAVAARVTHTQKSPRFPSTAHALRFTWRCAASICNRTRCLFLFGRTASMRRRVRCQCVGPTIS